MATTTLILARHGATAANLRRPYTLQGLRPDSDLAPEGVAQARAAAVALRPFPIAKVYSSPLRRAWQTARAIAADVAAEPGLAEVDTGLWTGLTWGEIEARWPDECRAFHEDPEAHGYLGGENLAQLRARVLPVIDPLLARHAGQTVLIVGHGVVNRVLLAHWLGLPLRFARRLPQDNAGFNVVEAEGGTIKVRTLNQAGHLERVSQRCGVPA
jgi:broad specificity phosphatase PhoE